VTVIPGADLTACFTVTPDPPDRGGASEAWDAGCSTGNGLEYRWVFSVPDQGIEVCFGMGPWDASSCQETDQFSPDLQSLIFGLPAMAGSTSRATLFIRDTDGNMDWISVDYAF
jgi:hypothetical protein